MQWKRTHLTYCLNIHPGETWEETRTAIERYAVAVKQLVAPNRPFGLGLRLSARAAEDLRLQTAEFRDYLTAAGMYVFTINGFPYGRFHGTRVKENVYKPDWSQQERLDYTEHLAFILADLLPDGMNGSISTVPVAYGKQVTTEARRNIFQAAQILARIEREKRKTIVLALEPEPDCVLETTGEILRFWDDLRSDGDSQALRHLGICLDACHMACGFESPAEAIRRLETAGISVPKVHISSALVVSTGASSREILEPFVDEVYLHQTRVLSDGGILRFSDLPDALENNPSGEWRVHFHVPLHYGGCGQLSTTSFLLDREFFLEALKPGRHLEIETYSFDVLPGAKGNVVDSIAAEFKWVMEIPLA